MLTAKLSNRYTHVKYHICTDMFVLIYLFQINKLETLYYIKAATPSQQKSVCVLQ